MALIQVESLPLVHVGATLGEGPIWVERDRALWFVDIKAPRVYRFDPARNALDHWESPDQVGWVVPTTGNHFVAGVKGGLHLFDPRDGSFGLHLHIEADLSDNRLNDVAVDPEGRLWFGSMHDGEATSTGRLYRYADGQISDSGVEPVVITNGPAISPDGTRLYHVDTVACAIDEYAIDPRGHLTGPIRFLTVDPALGYPDGATCDADGGVWVGFWGGWAARRYAIDGTQTHEVRFPTANITKVAIGGPDGRTGYATSARKGLDEAALAAQPNAGNVFHFPAPFPGVPVRPVSLDFEAVRTTSDR